MLRFSEVYPLLAVAPRLLVGSVFLIASVSKVLQPNGIRRALEALNLDHFPHILPILVGFEFLLGLSLLTGAGGMAGTLAASATLISFVFVHMRLSGLGFRDDCGCFGDSHGPRSFWSLPIRNVGLIVTLGVGACLERNTSPQPIMIGVGLGGVAVLFKVVRYHVQKRLAVRAWEV